jgi:Zn-dependent metalloprotease
MVERYWKGEPGGITGTTWQVGEGCWTPATGGDALRYMYRPTNDGSSRDYYPSRYVGSSDNGGVHYNSGIQNNAFWLLATGGSHRLTGAMSGGIGADAATRIFYKYLKDYALPNDNLHYVRVYTQYAAGVLYGFSSVQYARTIEAWNKVAVP